jgi:hypothetical protein
MRSGLRTILVTLAGWFFGSLAHAQTSDKSADCLGMNGAKLPAKVTFDDGSVLTVIDRSGGKVRQEVLTADGRGPVAPTLEQSTAAWVTLARPLGRQREFLCGGNVDRLG